MTARILNAPLILSFTLSGDDIIRQDALTFRVILKNISVQYYSPPQGTGVLQYTGLNVRQGYWISNRIYGKAYQITSIDTINTTVSEVYCTVTDVDGYIAAISEDRINAPGEGIGFIFTTNEDGDPILTPADSAGIIAGQWQGDIVSHFSARRHKSQYVSIYQTVPKKTITDASITGGRTLYEVADTSGLTVGNTVIIEGIELDSATGYNGRGSIHAIDPDVSVTVNIESNGTPMSFDIATLRIASVPIGKDFVLGESIYIDSTGIFRKSAGSSNISDTIGIVTSKGIPSDDWFSFRPSGKYFDTSLVPNDLFPKSENIVGNVPLTPGMKLYINPNSAIEKQYTTVAPTSNPYATWVITGRGTSSATVWSATESYAQYAYVEHEEVYYFSINAITLDEGSPVPVSPDSNNTDWIPAIWDEDIDYVSGTPTFYPPTETFYISQGGAVGDNPSSTPDSWTKTNIYRYPSANRAIYIAGSGGGGSSSNTVVTGTVQVFDGGDPTWVSAPPTTIYPVLDCGVLF